MYEVVDSGLINVVGDTEEFPWALVQEKPLSIHTELEDYSTLALFRDRDLALTVRTYLEAGEEQDGEVTAA